MTNPIVAAAGPGGRPRTVTIARVLSFTIAVLLVIAGAAFVAGVLSLSATITGDNSDQLTPDQVDQGLHVLGAVGGVGILILVAGHLTAGFLLGRPSSNGGRITAWIVDGATLLCCGCGLATSFLNSSGMNTTSNGQSVSITTGQSSAALSVVVAAATGVSLLAAMAVIILLVLPDSSDYFRRPPTVWTPGQQWPAPQPAFGAPGAWQPPQYGQPGQPPQYGQPGQPPQYGQPPIPPGALPPGPGPMPPAPGTVPPLPGAPQPPFSAPPPAYGQPPAPGQPTGGQPQPPATAPHEGQPPAWGPPPSTPPNPYGPPNPNDPTAPPSEQR